MTDYADLIECPNCGSIADEDDGYGRCHVCGEVWDMSDDVPPENDETQYEEPLL